MSSLRDTSADAAAELGRRELPGQNDPPITLEGFQAHRVRAALKDSYAKLEKTERACKLWREREGIRAVRIAVGAALAYLPEPKPSAPIVRASSSEDVNRQRETRD